MSMALIPAYYSWCDNFWLSDEETVVQTVGFYFLFFVQTLLILLVTATLNEKGVNVDKVKIVCVSDEEILVDTFF